MGNDTEPLISDRTVVKIKLIKRYKKSLIDKRSRQNQGIMWHCCKTQTQYCVAEEIAKIRMGGQYWGFTCDRWDQLSVEMTSTKEKPEWLRRSQEDEDRSYLIKEEYSYCWLMELWKFFLKCYLKFALWNRFLRKKKWVKCTWVRQNKIGFFHSQPLES